MDTGQLLLMKLIQEKFPNENIRELTDLERIIETFGDQILDLENGGFKKSLQNLKVLFQLLQLQNPFFEEHRGQYCNEILDNLDNLLTMKWNCNILEAVTDFFVDCASLLSVDHIQQYFVRKFH
jgi:hypothetical protein